MTSFLNMLVLFILKRTTFLALAIFSVGSTSTRGDTLKIADWGSSCSSCGYIRYFSDFENQKLSSSDPAKSIVPLQTGDSRSNCLIGKVKSRKPAIEFEGGTDEDRSASIVSSNQASNNRAMAFTLKNAAIANKKNVVSKGRVQLSLYGIEAAKEIRFNVRFFLGSGFDTLSDYPGKIEWLTISEWWNNASWKLRNDYPFRMTVNLVKPTANKGPILFSVRAETYDRSTDRWINEGLWNVVNEKVPVPIGEWASLEYHIIEGDSETGLFSLNLTDKSGKMINVFDIVGFTHHPKDLSPDGFTEINPVKLYTSKRVIDFVRSKNHPLDILWDDFDLLAQHVNSNPSFKSCN